MILQNKYYLLTLNLNFISSRLSPSLTSTWSESFTMDDVAISGPHPPPRHGMGKILNPQSAQQVHTHT